MTTTTGGQQTEGVRRNDPGRRDRIIDACLDVIAEVGVAGTSHRRVADAAGVPLGSMTYHFTGMNELLHEAFTRFGTVESGCANCGIDSPRIAICGDCAPCTTAANVNAARKRVALAIFMFRLGINLSYGPRIPSTVLVSRVRGRHNRRQRQSMAL